MQSVIFKVQFVISNVWPAVLKVWSLMLMVQSVILKVQFVISNGWPIVLKIWSLIF